MLLQELKQAWGPWRQLDVLQDALAHTLWDTRSEEPRFPALNVWTNETEAVVTAEIPGVDPQALDLQVSGDTMILRGVREPVTTRDGDTLLRQERSSGAFSRSLQFPFQVDADRIAASAKNGVLSIRVPRSEAEKPRKISVNHA